MFMSKGWLGFSEPNVGSNMVNRPSKRYDTRETHALVLTLDRFCDWAFIVTVDGKLLCWVPFRPFGTGGEIRLTCRS